MLKRQPAISVTTPCHEDWSAMSPVAKGMHCAACQTVVIDFTLMSDGEILDIIRQANRPTCGRFAEHQLDRALVDSRYRQPFFKTFMKRAVAMLVLCQGMATAALAQHAKGSKHTQQQPIKKKRAIDTTQLQGKVLDYYTHQPVSNAKVYISGTRSDTVTNDEGMFTFHIMGNTANNWTVSAKSDSGYVADATITMAELKAGKELTLYRYKIEQLPQHIVAAYTKPLVERYTVGGFNVREVADARGIDVTEIRTPKPSAKPTTFWQRITHPFKKKQHE